MSGLRQPVGALHSGDGSHRLFILEKEGYVKILTPEGEIFKEPYLDIHKLVQSGIKVGFLNFIYLCSGYVNFILGLSLSLKVFVIKERMFKENIRRQPKGTIIMATELGQ